MNSDIPKFETGFDSLTRSVAKTVNKFFTDNTSEILSSLSDENIGDMLFSYINEHHQIQMADLKTSVKKVDEGYSGSILSSSIKKPLFFEIIFEK